MSIRNLNVLNGTLLLLIFSALSTNAVKANSLETKELQTPSEFSATQEHYLIAQSLGHEEWAGKPQMSWNDYQTGRVVGKNGSNLSVIADDGTLIHGDWEAAEIGDTVLIVEEDGKKEVLEAAHPAWVEVLEQESAFTKENDQRSDPPLEVRTAPLWRQLGY